MARAAAANDRPRVAICAARAWANGDDAAGVRAEADRRRVRRDRRAARAGRVDGAACDVVAAADARRLRRRTEAGAGEAGATGKVVAAAGGDDGVVGFTTLARVRDLVLADLAGLGSFAFVAGVADFVGRRAGMVDSCQIGRARKAAASERRSYGVCAPPAGPCAMARDAQAALRPGSIRCLHLVMTNAIVCVYGRRDVRRRPCGAVAHCPSFFAASTSTRPISSCLGLHLDDRADRRSMAGGSRLGARIAARNQMPVAILRS